MGHVLFFSKATVAKCCRMEDLEEYQSLVSRGARCPLYTLIKEWVFREYPTPAAYATLGTDVPMAPEPQGPTLEVTNLSFSYAQGLPPCLKDMSFAFNRGARILVVGANGACKSTVMSILGGKRMIPRGFAKILGKDCFNDSSIGKDVMYCGDWWNTQFFVETTIGDLLGQNNARRRCQLLEILVPHRP